MKRLLFSDAVGHSLSDEIKAYAEKLYTDEEFEKKEKNILLRLLLQKSHYYIVKYLKNIIQIKHIWLKIFGCQIHIGKDVKLMIHQHVCFLIMGKVENRKDERNAKWKSIRLYTRT